VYISFNIHAIVLYSLPATTAY